MYEFFCMMLLSKPTNSELVSRYADVTVESSNSSDRLATGYELKGRGSVVDKSKFYLSSKASGPALGTAQPLIQWVSGALSPGVKRPRRETDHSSSSSVEIRNGGDVFKEWSLIKRRDNFKF
jgi:hypothetical protein